MIVLWLLQFNNAMKWDQRIYNFTKNIDLFFVTLISNLLAVSPLRRSVARYGLRSPAALWSGHSWALSKCLEGPSARQQERIHLDRRHKVGEGGDQEVLRRSPSLQTARLYAYFRSVCSSKSSWRHIQLFHRLLGVHLHCATVPRYWYFIPTGLEQHVEFAIVVIIFVVLVLLLFSIITKSHTVYTNKPKQWI